MTEKKQQKRGPGTGAPPANQYALKGTAPATATVQVRVETETKARWQKRADEAGLKLSEWIRARCDEVEDEK